MRLSHNLASLNIYQAQTKILQKQSNALQRISSGVKINSAKDDPNGLAQSERLKMQIRGTQMAGRDLQDGISMLQTAGGGASNISDMLIRIRELTVQAGSGAYTQSDKDTIKNEIDELKKGIDDIANNTEFNGVKILANVNTNDNSNPFKVSMPTGANVGEKVDIPMYNITSDKLLSNMDFNTSDGINNALGDIDNAINTVTSINSKYGALENRFESSYENLDAIGDKMQDSESSISDADIAEEMMEYAKDNVLSEAGTAMMVQSNKFPQDVLRILENVRSR